MPLGDMVLISDYGKGVCTMSLLEGLGTRARGAAVPILVDPARGRKWSDYGHVTLIKANWAEAIEVASTCDERPLALARRLADEHQCHIVVTIGRHGMVCGERDGATWYLSAEPTHVRDACGAGDTVLGTLGVEFVRCQSLRAACQLILLAAAHQVQHIGVTSVTPVTRSGCRWVGK